LVVVKNLEFNKENAKRVLACAPLSKTKLKLDNEKLKFLKEYNNKEIVTKILDKEQKKERTEENAKLEQQNDLVQVVNTSAFKKHLTNLTLEDDVLMVSKSAPQSPQIEVQEYYSINKYSPFSEVVDKRVSEYLGNKSYISNYYSTLKT